jgi:hypothetical protein
MLIYLDHALAEFRQQRVDEGGMLAAPAYARRS